MQTTSAHEAFSSELLGTACLVLIGNSSIALVNLRGSKNYQVSAYIPCIGYALALFMGIASCRNKSDAHLNPAITLAWWMADGLDVLEWRDRHYVGSYLLGQMVGALVGQLLVYLSYLQFYTQKVNEYLLNDSRTKEERNKMILTTFCTSPAEPKYWVTNCLNELIGTMVLALLASLVGGVQMGLVLGGVLTGLSGPTGSALNPARDLVPRVLHQVLPIPMKGPSEWSYSWLPVVLPCLGALMGRLLASLF